MQSLKEHTANEQTPITELYTHEYDHAGRLLKTKYKINDKPEVILNDMTASGSYDELGRLRIKKRHNSTDTEEIDYNIRNWTTRLKSGGFEEKLFYNTGLPSGVTACYNGNIAYQTWKAGSPIVYAYRYTYDNLNRLKYATAYNGYNSPTSSIGYSEDFGYDKQGNINFLQRKSGTTMVDYLSFGYNGNQLTSIFDYSGSQNQYTIKEYQNKSSSSEATNEMAYDPNGNMIKDLDRDIVTIRYNLLNLPQIIQFKNGNQICNTYDAGGQKLSTLYYTLMYTIPAPVTEGSVLDLYYDPDIIDETGTFYVDNFEYGFNGCDPGWYWKQRIDNAEGYVACDNEGKFGAYNYYRRDHLGNNREVWSANNNTTIQRTHYYPSGLPWNTATGIGADVQNKKYNGKEFVEMHGWDEYDSQARTFYAAIVRTPTQDPHSENYYDTSPYAWCGNNFVNAFDLDGRDWYSYQEEYTDKDGKKQTRTAYQYVEGQMSKKEIKNGGFTHLGLTYTNGNDYYSLFGSKKDLKTDEGLLYKKVDEAVINYVEATIENLNQKYSSNSWDTEDKTNYGYTDFSIKQISGKTNFNYEGSYYGLYINFTGKGMNGYFGDTDPPIR